MFAPDAKQSLEKHPNKVKIVDIDVK